MPVVEELDFEQWVRDLTEEVVVSDLRASAIPTTFEWESPTTFTVEVPAIEKTFLPAVDMKPRLLAHGKRTKPHTDKHGKTTFGHRYQIIPFGWRTTSQGWHGPLGAKHAATDDTTLRQKSIPLEDMTASDQARLKAKGAMSLNYLWKAMAGKNMVSWRPGVQSGGRMAQGHHYFPTTGRRPLAPHQGITFRAVSEKSPAGSWWYPARSGWKLTTAAKATLRWLGVW